MDMRRFTEKSALALSNTQRIARENGNQELTQAHLLCALLEDKEGLIVQLLSKWLDTQALEKRVQASIAKLPKVQGGESYIGNTLTSVLESAESISFHESMRLVKTDSDDFRKIYADYAEKYAMRSV